MVRRSTPFAPPFRKFQLSFTYDVATIALCAQRLHGIRGRGQYKRGEKYKPDPSQMNCHILEERHVNITRAAKREHPDTTRCPYSRLAQQLAALREPL